MREKQVGQLVQTALDLLSELTLAKQKEIARLGREQEKIGDEWLLDPTRGVWVQLDQPAPMPEGTARVGVPQPGGKDVQAADAAGAVRTDS